MSKQSQFSLHSRSIPRQQGTHHWDEKIVHFGKERSDIYTFAESISTIDIRGAVDQSLIGQLLDHFKVDEHRIRREEI